MLATVIADRRKSSEELYINYISRPSQIAWSADHDVMKKIRVC